MELDQISRFIDVASFAMIAFMVIRGFANGLIIELGFLTSLALSYYAAINYGPALGQRTIGLIFPNSAFINKYVGYFGAAAIVMITNSIIYRIISDKLSKSGARTTIAMLGGFVAFVKAVVICFFGLEFVGAAMGERSAEFNQARENSKFEQMIKVFKGTVISEKVDQVIE